MANLLATTFCNLCFNSQVEGKQTFFITSCSHVFCSACLTNHPSFCRLCNNQCKVLEVNEQMPSEVKMFFEDSSIQRMIQSVEKINSFQENQVSIYINSCSKYQTKYHNNKKNAKSLLKTKNEVLESLKREKEIMETLKNAYKTNVITTDLFKLGTPPQSTQPPQLQEKSRDNPKFASSTPRSSSPVLTPTSSSSGLGNSSIRSSASSSPAISPIFAQQPIVASDKKNLLESTLRHMQEASQLKYQQMRRDQMKKNR